MCRLLGSASVSSAMDAPREFPSLLFAFPPCPRGWCARAPVDRALDQPLTRTWGVFSAQFVPQISKDPSVEVINFCRTPQWYVPRVSSKFGAMTIRAACAVG